MSVVDECVFTSTLNCPCVITAAGTYKLLQDVTCNGCTGDNENAAIKIQSNDVILDLNGKTLSGGGDCLTGIHTTAFSNGKVSGGTIHGFSYSVFGSDSADNFIADSVLFTGFSFTGIEYYSSSNLQILNSVFEVMDANGIYVSGVGVMATDNTFKLTGIGAKGIYCDPCNEFDAMHNIFSHAGEDTIGILIGPASTDAKIHDNCFHGPTDVDLGADAAFEDTIGILIDSSDPYMKKITSNSFNTLANGVYFENIDGNDNSVFEENCFAYDNLAVNIENKYNFEEFGPNNLYNNQIDYQILDSGSSKVTTIFGSVMPNPPAPAPLCSKSAKSQKLPIEPFGGYCPCRLLKLTEVPSMSPSAEPTKEKHKGKKIRESKNN